MNMWRKFQNYLARKRDEEKRAERNLSFEHGGKVSVSVDDIISSDSYKQQIKVIKEIKTRYESENGKSDNPF